MKPKIILLGACISLFLLLGLYFSPLMFTKPKVQEVFPTLVPTLIQEEVWQPKSVFLDVPFAVQAPFAEWSDPRQQDACEEAASLMVVFALKNQILSPRLALMEILKMAAWQKETFGESRDTSAKDTADRILKRYFGLAKIEVRDVTSINDLIKELMIGNLVIVPVNGQKLNNPNFTGAGPERHMLVIRGFDVESQEFISNDPGIYQGEKYRYPATILFDALRDYLTGYHLPISSVEKRMIVVKRN